MMRGALVALVLIGSAGCFDWKRFDPQQRCSAYEEAVLADSPFLYVRLGEGSGSAAVDRVRPSSPGSYGGELDLGVPGALAGDPDTAVHLGEGAAGPGRVRLPRGGGPFADSPTSWTVELWFRRDETVSGAVELFSCDRSGVAGFRIDLVEDSGVNAVRIYTGESGGTGASTEALVFGGLSSGEWHHLVVARCGADVLSVLDGEAGAPARLGIQSELPGTEPFSDLPVVVGSRSSAGRVDLSVDEVAVYASCLPWERVVAHLQAGRGGAPCDAQ